MKNDNNIRKKLIEVYKKSKIYIRPEEFDNIEVTDFGLDNFFDIGLGIIIYVNTNRVCAKELAMTPYQICPQHRHPNISKSPGKEETFTRICEEFGKNIPEHIAVYGADNDQRLTGLHETQSIDKFSYGALDRGASIRIPVNTIEDGWKGRLEDRRPASNADPYKVAAVIIQSTKKALA